MRLLYVIDVGGFMGQLAVAIITVFLVIPVAYALVERFTGFDLIHQIGTPLVNIFFDQLPK